jgi:hypothetical protein
MVGVAVPLLVRHLALVVVVLLVDLVAVVVVVGPRRGRPSGYLVLTT